MSWDRFEYDEFSPCACGCGKIIRRLYQEDDDWNRSRGGCLEERIECNDCKNKYHIEHLIHHYFCYKWDGDGISDKIYLVPNGLTIPKPIEKRSFHFSNFDEKIAAEYTPDSIKQALEDMKKSRYSTRLQLKTSQVIVKEYFKQYKKKKLTEIITCLENILNNYENYKWTPEKIETFKVEEQDRIAQNAEEIKNTLANCVELTFHR